MFRGWMASILVVLITGLSCPVFAGDLVSPKLLPREARYSSRTAWPGRMAAFGLPQSGQSQASPQQAAPRTRSKAGKILTIVGLGVAGAGVAMVVAAPKESTVYSSGDSSVNVNWRYTGYAWIGIGGVLSVIGLIKLSK
jgi:hypothetical protein